MTYDLGDYNDVASRIAEFRAKYPSGSLQPANPAEPYRLLEVAGKTYLAYTAAAYRTPDDERPGIGCAWEVVPGRTPYTKDSELMVAETSAWGRALIAVGAADAKKGIASADEVANRRPANRARVREAKGISEPQMKRLHAMFTAAGMRNRDDRLLYCAEVIGRAVASSTELTFDEARVLIDSLQNGVDEPKSEPPA